MFEMSITSLLNSLVEAKMKAENKEENRALAVSFDVRLGVYESGLDIFERAGLHLLYYVKPGMRYISVFFGATESPFAKLSEVTWRHVVTHDSCWRDVSDIASIYFEMADRNNAALAQRGLPAKAPSDMRQNVFFPLFGDPLRWVPAKVELDPTDTHRYRRIVTLL